MNKVKRMGAVGLIVIGLGALISSVAKIAGIDLPDVVRGIIGIVDLAAVPIVVYAAFKTVGDQK